MKTVVEFGVRGGAHTENLVVPSAKLAGEIARKLVMVFTNDPHHPGATQRDWKLGKNCPRMSWASSTHFVSISKLDGVPRGPASGGLWRKSDQPVLVAGPY